MYSKTVLIGRLGKDPAQRATQNGTVVTTFSLATTEKWSGEEKTTWHNVVTWKGLAEVCGKYLHKGSLVMIEGTIQNRDYEDSNGDKRYITEIVAREMKMLDSKGSQGGHGEPPLPDAPSDTGEPGVPF